MKAESLHLALIGDLVGSRAAADRAGLQRALLEAVDAVNAALETALRAPLRVMSGDEVQGLLAEPRAAIEAMWRLSDRLHPAPLAFGLGWGPLATPLPARGKVDTGVLDGACYHHAREALEAAQSRGAWGAGLGFSGPGEPFDALLELIGTVRGRWTDKQARYAAAAREDLQKDVAQEFGVSPSVVSESLKAAHFEAVLRGEAAAEAWISDSALKPNSKPNR